VRRVEILVTCDPCLAWKGRDVSEGVETVPVIDGHTLDLCPDHREGLRAVLALIGEFADHSARVIEALPAGLRGKRREAALAASRAAEASVEPGKRNRRGGKRARARAERAAVVVEAEAIAVEAAEAERLACPLCTHTSPTTGALGMHLTQRHGTTPSALYGPVCPLCGHESGNGQAAATHARSAHEVSGGLAALFARALAEGDPHGIVAARISSVASQGAAEG
jgi:hypothetical protein